jgi:hypothetical protein
LGEQLLCHGYILNKALQTKSLSAAEGQKMDAESKKMDHVNSKVFGVS